MKKIPALTVYLILSAAFAVFSNLVFTYNLVYQATIAHLNPLQLVLVGTVLEGAVFIFEVPTGVVADVYSRRLSIIIGYFMIGAGFLIEGSFPRFELILLAQVIWGVGYTFTSGATDAWIADEIARQAGSGDAADQQAGIAFLRGGQVARWGSAAGILAAIPLAAVQVSLPVRLGGLLTVLLALFLLVFMPEDGFQPAAPAERSTWRRLTATFRNGLGMVERRPALASILAVGLFFGLYSEGFDRLWTKFLLDGYQLPMLGFLGSNAWFGLIRWASIWPAIGLTGLVERRLNAASPYSTARTLLFLSVFLVAGLLAFAWSNSLVMAVSAYLLIAALRSTIGPVYTVWVNQRLDPQVRATVLSMSSQVDAFGQIAAGPALGWIGSRVSVRAALTASAFLLIPAAPLLAGAMKSGAETGDRQELRDRPELK